MRIKNKEFAFTKLMTCGLCGSGICADEKFKKLKDGSVNRHVYYGCTKVRDKNCKCGYINEIDLIEQFQKLMEKVNIDEIGIREKIKVEVMRFKRFQHMALGSTSTITVETIDIRNYLKFILKHGQDLEKRELLSCLKSKIFLNSKTLSLEN
jgi:hypothetical protein